MTKPGRKKGSVPWNKGKKVPQLNGNIYAFKGKKASKWAGHKRASKLLAHIKHCQKCGEEKTSYQLVVHHKNGDQLDNKLSNLEKLCRSCHINHHRSELEAAKVKKYGNKYGPRTN